MEWMQVLTNLLSVGAPMAGAVYIFYSITSSRIDKMETFHREDMKAMDNHHREDMKSMDAKWERLFEKFLPKEQGKGG